MRRLLIALLISLAACTATPDKNLHDLTLDEAPYWDLESLAGFDDALRKAYETKNYFWINDGQSPIDFDDLDYAEFSKFNGKVRIYKSRNKENHMSVSFSACNGIRAIYERDGDLWKYVVFGQTTIACERGVKDKSGKQVILYTAMVADDWFAKLARDIANYDVSPDGQTLTLTNIEGEPLGIFKKRAKT